jgi:phosphatidylserine/phosphatidylglycerophosphate/cardiolipin synthase-like enzyme
MASPINLSHDTLTDLVQHIAKQLNASPESVLEELAFRYLYETALESLDDEQILALSDLRLTEEQQEKLSALLEAQREGQLDVSMKQELEAFMQRYGTMQVRKAQAMAEAVQRGLRPARLEDWPEQK